MKQDDDDDAEPAVDLSPAGIKELYTGITANLLKEGPPSGLYLGIYETVKGLLLADHGPAGGATISPLLAYLISGAVGEFFGSVIRAPGEAVKTRMQTGIASGPLDAVKQLSKEPALLLSTWSVSLARDVPFGALQIAIFELSKTAILNNPNINLDVNSLFAEAALGFFAGGIGAFITTPADVVITRLITEDVEEGVAPTSPLDMTKRIFDEGGPAAFLNGAKERVGYWAPSIAIFLSLYCRLRGLGLDLFPQ
jgi:hypothetical protein